MKLHNFLLPTAVFAAGGALAWIMVPIVSVTASGQGEGHVESGRFSKSSIRSHDAREASKTRAMLNKLLASAAADKSGGWEPGEIAEADYSALLAELIKRVEASGMTEENERMMNSLIWDWHDANPDAALSWVLERENHKLANGLLSTLIGKVADKDLNAAIALAERHGAAQGRHIQMPSSLWIKLGEADAETFTRVFACFQNRSGSSGIIAMQYAEGFDFRNTLDKLSSLRAGLEEGTYLSVIPLNLLSEWAKRDWNAAWEWAASGEKSMFKDLPDLVNRAAGHASMKQIAGYAAQIASLPNRTAEENFRDAESILSNRPIPELINEFLSQMPGDRQENLNGILAASLYGSGINSDATRQTLLSQMTPAERVAAFQSGAVQQLTWLNRDASASLLSRLGHSDEEIARMLPPAPKK